MSRNTADLRDILQIMFMYEASAKAQEQW